MGDRHKCQTFAASPAEPGGFPVCWVLPDPWLRVLNLASAKETNGGVLDAVHGVRLRQNRRPRGAFELLMLPSWLPVVPIEQLFEQRVVTEQDYLRSVWKTRPAKFR